MKEITYSPESRDKIAKRISAIFSRLQEYAKRNGYQLYFDNFDYNLGIIPSFVNVHYDSSETSADEIELGSNASSEYWKTLDVRLRADYLDDRVLALDKSNLALARKFEQGMCVDLDIQIEDDEEDDD